MKKHRLSGIIRMGRLHFLPGGFLLYSLGALLAYESGARVSLEHFLLGYLPLLFAHASLSYSNEYFDAEGDRHGKPRLFSGGSGVLVKHPWLRKDARNMALSLIALSILAAAANVAFFSFDSLLLAVVFLGNLYAWFYSGPPLRFSYRGLGELATAAGIGLIFPGYGYFMNGGVVCASLIYAVPLLFFGATFILGVELPDIDGDRKAGKKTLASFLGQEKTFIFIAVAAFLSMASFAVLSQLLGVLALLPVLLAFYGLMNRKKRSEKAARIASAVVASLFLFVALAVALLCLRVLQLH